MVHYQQTNTIGQGLGGGGGGSNIPDSAANKGGIWIGKQSFKKLCVWKQISDKSSNSPIDRS